MNRLTLSIWKPANLFFLTATAFTVASCNGGTPDCADDEVLNLAKQIISENTGDTDMRLVAQSVFGTKTTANWSTLRIDSVRFKGENEQTKAKTCAARYLVDTQSHNHRTPNETTNEVLGRDIVYTVELTSKSGEIYVTVQDTGTPSFVEAEPAPRTASPSATAKKQSMPNQLEAPFAGLVDQPSLTVLKNPDVRALIEPQSNGLYEVLLAGMTKSKTAEMIEGRYLVGSGCAEGECSKTGAFYMIDTRTEVLQFAAIFLAGELKIIAGPEDFIDTEEKKAKLVGWVSTFEE